jgi:hypothetical protein
MLNFFLQKFHILVLGLVALIDAKGIDVAQRLWPLGCPAKSSKTAKKHKKCIFSLF